MTPTTTPTPVSVPDSGAATAAAVAVAPASSPFVCSICDEASTQICVFCTKDCCPNHRCERCERCSDCCDCDNGKRTFRTANGAPPLD